jgi:hypothetical protein
LQVLDFSSNHAGSRVPSAIASAAAASRCAITIIIVLLRSISNLQRR